MTEQPHYSLRGSGSHMRVLGITQHVTPLTSSWTGELRVRFSDFLVNEIGKDGAVVHLRSIGSSEQQKEPQQAMNTTEGAPEESPAGQSSEKGERPSEKDAQAKQHVQEEPSMNIAADDVAALESLVGAKFAQELVEMFGKSKDGTQDKRASIASEPLEDKEKRGQVHQEIRRIFHSKIDTNTDPSGAIRASLGSSKRTANKRGRGGRNREEKPAGEYVHFTLFKDNRDTMEAVNQIARFLKVKPQVIGYAGTKDRRASTAQRCSVRYIRPRHLAAINGKLWGVVTGDYDYRDEPIHLGGLKGNEFTITIKKCQVVGESALSASERLDKIKAAVEPALAHMAEHGWINYFGHQRFGTHSIGTHEIGKLILAGKFKEAVTSLLSYDPEIAEKAERGEFPQDATGRDDYTRHQACMLFMTEKDMDKAASIVPRRFTAEVCVLRQLTRQGRQSSKDYIGAIIHITRGLRSMYLHAYQSLVWNHAASKRWQLYGEKVVKGDLVIAESDSTQAVTASDQDGDEIINPGDNYDDDDDAPVRARALSEEEALSGRYTVYDVVLPSPGYDVIYPDNEIGTFYEEFMGREENGSLDPHKMRRIHREFSLPGRYRKLMNRFLAQPSVELRAYADETEQMHPTDLDIIRATKRDSRKRPRAESNAEQEFKKTKVDGDGNTEAAPSANEEVAEAPAPEDQDEPMPMEEDKTNVQDNVQDKVAVIVKFRLGTSAYATVALRELMGDPPEGAPTLA